MHLPKTIRRRIVLTSAAVLTATGLFYGVKQIPPRKPVPAAAPQVGGLVQQANTAVKPAPQVPAAAVPDPKAKTEVQPVTKLRTYKVEAGDSIGTIAEKFGLSSSTIRWANDLYDDLINVGQELQIPAVDGLVYKVEPGDTVWDIAAATGANVDNIVTANPDMEPGSLKVGQVLLIPGGEPPSRRQVAVARSNSSRPQSRTFAYWPASGQLTDSFGWRIHPVYGTRAFHDGMDLGVSSGTPLRAVAAGTVTLAGRLGGYGIAIKIDHGGSVVTQYAHLSQADVSVGQTVAAGELIGYSGNTGVSTGPHLHFMVLVGGSPVDPIGWLP